MNIAGLLDEFRAEALEHLRALDAELLNLERNPADLQAIRRMFLSSHTIKGGAAMLGLESAPDLAHALEDVLAELRDQRQPLTASTADLIFQSVDVLRGLVDRALAGEARAEPAVAHAIEALRGHAAQLSTPSRTRALVEPAQPSLGGPPRAPGEGKPKVLLVEDSPTVRLLESMMLSDAGFVVDEATDGVDALERVLAEPYDLMVTGLELRGLRGLDMLAALRASAAGSDLPVIVMSSDENGQHRARACDLGALEYIRKGSLGQRRLVQAAQEALGQRPGG